MAARGCYSKLLISQGNMLENELHVKFWMINNQFSRRSLPTETRLALAYRFKEFEAEKARIRKAVTQFKVENADSLPVGYPQEEFEENELSDNEYINQPGETLDKATNLKGKTLEIIAQKAGVSHTTAEQYDAIQRKGTEEQKLF